MESLVLELLALSSIGFIAALTPGPDILYVLRNTLISGIKAGFLSLLGIFYGWLTFLALIYFGISHFFNGTLLQGILSLIGGFYLLYIAYCLLRKTKNQIHFNNQNNPTNTSSSRLILKGFLLNISNPKAILFFTIIISPFMNNHLELSLLVLLTTISLSFISVILLGAFFRNFINNTLFDRIDKVCGMIFIVFAILLLSASYNALSSHFL